MKKKSTAKTKQFVTCNKFTHKKTYQVEERKEKPGYAICPACGEYHKLNKE